MLIEWKSLAGCCLFFGIVTSSPAQGRLEILWKGWDHSDRINSIVVSPDGSSIISGGSDRLIDFWRISDGALLKTFNAAAVKIHESSVEALAISPDGQWLASASFAEIRIWRVADGALLRSLTKHTNWVISVDFSPDGKLLASGSFDSTVALWRVRDWSLARRLTGHAGVVRPVKFSPDGALLASGSGDTTIRLWQVADGSLVRTFQGHTADVESLAFSPDGKTLASGSEDYSIKLWNVSDGTLQRTLLGHEYFVYSLAFAPDGQTLASAGGEDNTIRIWRVSDGALRRAYTLETAGVNTLCFANTNAIAYGRTDATVLLGRVTPVSISSVGLDATGTFQVRVDGEVGRRFVLEASSDLAGWTSVVTNWAGAETFTFSDSPRLSSRFFRLHY